MGRVKDRINGFRFGGITLILIIFCVIGMILYVERSGISYHYGAQSLECLSRDRIIVQDAAMQHQTKDTLVLYDSENKSSMEALEQFKVILKDLKLGHELVDLRQKQVTDFAPYRIVIAMVSDISAMKDSMLPLFDWVNQGGDVLFPVVIQKSPYSQVLEPKLGIIESSYDTAFVEKLYIHEDFMVGGGRTFVIPDGYDSAAAVQLDPNLTEIYVWTDDDRKLPLIWKSEYGEGNFVVCNIGLYEKAVRGFYTASLSLLTDAFVYPVINGSTFYLDDFPSQIPFGDNEYIKRDYNVSVRDFYHNIWWPDMMNIAEEYGLKFTGLAIASYNDITDGTAEETADTGTFLTFGNMLLRMGGEIGYHGYNHQPLCLDNVDYEGLYEYNTWDSTDAMKESFDKLREMCEDLFEGIPFSVYVPPSNILSEEGEAFLAQEYPDIQTISGIYFDDEVFDYSCTQEYEVLENGIVHQPRLVSSFKLTPFMQLVAVSELNHHFVNSHFTHPDDPLDPERGAELGWEQLKKDFSAYLSWLRDSAPPLRNFTGSELSAAVQRFSAISYKQTMLEDRMELDLQGFYDDAQFMIRLNEKIFDHAEGGKVTHLIGDLYLLEAQSDKITIYFH